MWVGCRGLLASFSCWIEINRCLVKTSNGKLKPLCFSWDNLFQAFNAFSLWIFSLIVGNLLYDYSDSHAVSFSLIAVMINTLKCKCSYLSDSTKQVINLTKKETIQTLSVKFCLFWDSASKWLLRTYTRIVYESLKCELYAWGAESN